MPQSMIRMALILGLLSAVGPFSIDMYLPAMPQIGESLGASVAEVQLTITMYFLAFGVAQLIYGPLADAWGRRAPIMLGTSIFALGSVGCAMAPSVEWLIAFRFVQGLGGAAAMVIPRAIVRDMLRGPEATKLMAMIMLVISVSPMLAPLAGSAMMLLGSWRLIFWSLVIAAGLSLALTAFVLPETLKPADRVPVNLRQLGRGARVLLRDPVFMGLTLVGGFGFASFFVFLATASFVYSGQFGLSPLGFSLAFAVNAVGFFAASQFAGPLGARYGQVPMLRIAVWGFAGFALVNLGLILAGVVSLPLIVAFLFLGNACLGLIIPTTMVMALDEHGDIAGLASSLGGTIQMLAGGLMVTLTGPFFDSTALPMIAAIAACAVLSLGAALLTLHRVRAGEVVVVGQ
jgi:DHA1 family bicyclomycin/chloramphenicol resistance-like MFS transporter